MFRSHPFTLHYHHLTTNSNFLTRIVFFKLKSCVLPQLIHSNITNILTVPFKEKQALSPITILARDLLLWYVRINQCTKSNRFSKYFLLIDDVREFDPDTTITHYE